jgi:hypothetical protein
MRDWCEGQNCVQEVMYKYASENKEAQLRTPPVMPVQLCKGAQAAARI